MRTNLRLPDGQACVTCLALTDEKPSNTLSEKDHGDCHDCCVLAACHEGESDLTEAAFPVTVFHFLLLERPVTIDLPDIETSAPVLVFLASHPPTGPPPIPDGRAPPFVSMV